MTERTLNALTYLGMLSIGFGSLYVDRHISHKVANWSPVLLVLWVALMAYFQTRKKN